MEKKSRDFKVKDNVDLEKLTYFGFHNNGYAYINEIETEEYDTNIVNTFYIWPETRLIESDVQSSLEYIDTSPLIGIIFDLMSAGILEEVKK